MAHYAVLDENNVVTQVLYVDNQHILDENGNESEELGIAQCKEGLNDPNAKLIRTSYNNNIRVRYAGIGFSYNEELDAFIPPKPYPSCTLNTTTYNWELPIPMPSTQPENGYYKWDEEEQNWIVETFPPKEITSNSFRSQLTLTEKLLWDNPETGTITQKAAITTFQTELPLTEGTEELNELLDLLVSAVVFTQQRLDEIISSI